MTRTNREMVQIFFSIDARRFPVETTTIQVDGVKTNVVQCSYDDHIMIRVTQIGKMGTLLARKEGCGTAPTFNISILRASAMTYSIFWMLLKFYEFVFTPHPLNDLSSVY